MLPAAPRSWSRQQADRQPYDSTALAGSPAGKQAGGCLGPGAGDPLEPLLRIAYWFLSF